MRAIVAATVLGLFGGCLHAPMAWSPDGKWLAYVVEVRPIGEVLRPGWLFDAPRAPGRSAKSPPSAYRLWATRADSGASTLLEESPNPVTAPGWSPDGRALAFGRVVTDAGGPGRFEVVVLDGPGRRRVIWSRPLPSLTAEAARLPGQAIAWSPDGKFLAVPQFAPNGLAIVRADSGRLVNTLVDAFLPSWAPEGGRLAFFVRGTGDTLQCVDSALGQPRILCEVGQAGQAPAWTRDGSTVVVVARRTVARGAEPPGELAELLRVRLDTGVAETLRPLTTDVMIGRDRALEGVSIAFNRDGDDLFTATVVEGQPNQITWYRPREHAIYKKFAILDYTAPMGSLSLSPDGKTLAARVGSVDRLSPPALCDLDSNDMRSRLVAPDDAARVEWIAILVGTARTILGGLPVASTEPRTPAASRVARPTLLPILTEFEPNSEPTFRLRRIGKMGRPLCDRPADAPPADPATLAILAEARLFFDYLKEDYPAALASLEALEGLVESPGRRRDLLTVRAQIFLNRGELDRAGRTIDYLKEHDARPGRRVEWTGAGYALTDEPAEGQGWPDYLALRASTIRALLRDDGPDHHANPDAPMPNRVNPFVRDQAPHFFPGERPFLEGFPGEPPVPRRPGPRPPAPGVPKP